MDEQTIIETLADNGGKLWEKNLMRRIYFNPEIVMSLDINKYNTGNISGASCEGSRISNSEAYRALSVKFWYDLSDNKFHWKNADTLHSDCKIAIDNFVEKLRSKLS